MNERMKFITRLNQGERMKDLCLEFGISRKQGYKFKDRFEAMGIIGLEDQKRGPKTAKNKTSEYLEGIILKIKDEKATWGAPKIREHLRRKFPSVATPATSTIHSILDKHDLVKKRSRRPQLKTSPTYLSKPKGPNDLWCIDYKGQFRMQNKKYCYPLTITDQVSRFLLACEGFESISELDAKMACTHAFETYGLPTAIRSDNGTPFSSRAIWGLSKLSIWWLRLGIRLERITPGRPQENGRHERMHRTLKLETTRPPGIGLLQQQEIFDDFRDVFNLERPHEGIGMKLPTEIYTESTKRLPSKLPELAYSDCDEVKLVTKCGHLCLAQGRRIFISEAFIGQQLGVSEVEDGIIKIDFMDYTLGFADPETNKLAVSESPFIQNI